MTARVEPIGSWSKDVSYVADNLRSYDTAELWCINRDTPHRAIAQGLMISQESYLGYWNDRPVTVFGCHTEVIGMRGVPWLLGTDELTRNPLPFLRFARRYRDHLLRRHSLLTNVVHSQNTPSVLFLEALGFEMSAPYQTMTGAVVRTFTMKGLYDV